MPRRDHRVERYLGTPTNTALGQNFVWVKQEDLWAECKQVRTNVKDLDSAFTGDTCYKVTIQTPLVEYDLERTRFVWTWHGRRLTLKPWSREIRSGTRSEVCMYYCKVASDIPETP